MTSCLRFVGTRFCRDAAACLLFFSAVRGGPCVAQPAATPRIFAPIVLIADDPSPETISVARFSNTLESVGIAHQRVGIGKAESLNPLRFQLVIVALNESQSDRSTRILGRFLRDVLASGGNVIFIGPRICDLDRELVATFFGVRSRSSQCLVNSGVGQARVLHPRPFALALYSESMADLVSVGASTPVRVNRKALLTRYSGGPGHGQAVVLTAPLIDYWKVDDPAQAFKRPLLLDRKSGV
jgi:hypothetical protein